MRMGTVMGSANRNAKLVGAAAMMALAAVLGLAGCSGGTTGDTYVTAEAEHSITATASAEVKVVPDKAKMSLGVVSSEKTADEAQAANAEAVDAVIAALKAAGIGEKSIRTEYVYLDQAYNPKNGEPNGYEMTTSLTVEDIDVNDVGTIAQAAVNAGATRMDGISYYASGYDKAYDEALAQAIEASRVKADTMASAAGVRAGALVKLVEGYQDTSSRYVQGNAMENAIAEEDSLDATGAKSMTTMPGELAVHASVTATYAI